MVYEVLQNLFFSLGANLVSALVLLLAGILAGKIVGMFIKRFLEALKIREGIENIGVEATFLGIDLVELTRIFAEWYTYLYFLLAALVALNVPSLATFIEEIKTFSLLIVEAIIVTYLGLQIASYVKRNLELYSKYPLISAITYYFLLYLTAIMSLTVVYPQAAMLMNYLLLVVVASAGVGIGVGAAIAIGLGTKDLVADTVGIYFRGNIKKVKTKRVAKKQTTTKKVAKKKTKRKRR